MSCLQNELLLESLYEQVLEERPELSELEAIRLTEESVSYTHLTLPTKA